MGTGRRARVPRERRAGGPPKTNQPMMTTWVRAHPPTTP